MYNVGKLQSPFTSFSVYVVVVDCVLLFINQNLNIICVFTCEIISVYSDWRDLQFLELYGHKTSLQF